MAGPPELERGIALHRAGDLAGAARAYEVVLAREPDNADALHLLGLVAYRNGRLEEARAMIGRALARQPRNPVFHANLGNVAKDAGDIDAAAASYRQALEADPRMTAPRNNLGTLLLAQGRLADAIACFRAVIAQAPAHARAWFNLGSALARSGSLADAATAHGRALELEPRNADAWGELGLVLIAQGRAQEAVAAFRRRIDCGAANASAHADLALALHRSGELAAAREQYERALDLAPDALEIRCNYCALLQKTCDWTRLDHAWPLVAAAVAQGQSGVPHGLLIAQPGVTADMQLRAAKANAVLWSSVPTVRAPSSGAAARTTRTRVRVGYLSADFRAHATGYLTAELFECHDRSRFEVVLLSYGPADGSAMRARLEAAADDFIDLEHADDDAAAARIAACDLDVLVDLNGNTDNGRMAIAARRPAPLQVNWLGFPGTLGVAFYDYLIADRTVIPAGEEAAYAEKIVRLPQVYQSNDRRRPRPRVAPPRAALGLPADAVVLVSFNQAFKLNRPTVELWLDVLAAWPDTVLWLLEDNPVATAALRSALAGRGLAPDRLVMAPRLPLDAHLARYLAADLAIDTFPCSSHTTASDSLWVGCPLATLAGQTFASRVAASLVRAAGMPDFVAENMEDYRVLLMRLAGDRSAREGARERAGKAWESPVFDTPRFARSFERALSTLVARHRERQAPKGFEVREDGVD